MGLPERVEARQEGAFLGVGAIIDGVNRCRWQDTAYLGQASGDQRNETHDGTS